MFCFIIILLWPYPAEAKRLIYAVLPIMVGQIFSLVNYIPSFTIGQIIIRPVSLLILAILFSSIPDTLLIANRFLQPLPPELEGYRRTKHLYSSNSQDAVKNLYYAKILLEDMKNLKDELPESAIIYSIKPSIISLYSNRLSLLPPGEINTDNSIYYKGDESLPVFFYMMAVASPSIRTPSLIIVEFFIINFPISQYRK